MVTISEAELLSHFSQYRDLAQNGPVLVTHPGCESVVILSVNEYQRLKQHEPRDEPLTEERKNEIRHCMETHRSTIEKLAQ